MSCTLAQVAALVATSPTMGGCLWTAPTQQAPTLLLHETHDDGTQIALHHDHQRFTITIVLPSAGPWLEGVRHEIQLPINTFLAVLTTHVGQAA